MSTITTNNNINNNTQQRVTSTFRPTRPSESFPLPPQPIKYNSITREPFSINRSNSINSDYSKTTTRNLDFEKRVSIDELSRNIAIHHKIHSSHRGGYRGGYNTRRKSSTPPPPSTTINQTKTSNSTNSLESTNSSTSSNTYQLSSPFPRSQAFTPTLHQSEQPQNYSNLPPTLPNKDDKENNSTPIAHIRLRNSPSIDGFPYRSSSALAFTENYDHHIKEEKEHDQHEEEEEGEDGSDVDLDLSFDFHPATRDRNSSLLEYARDSIILDDGLDNWTGRDRNEGGNSQTRRGESNNSSSGGSTSSSNEFGISEREVVRSDSGQLIGTKKRVKSVLGLRQAYFEGEEKEKNISILMDSESNPKRHVTNKKRVEGTGNSTARTEWVRKTSLDPTLNLNTIARRTKSDSKIPTYHRSIGTGFAYNPTDPLNIPLPDSPLTNPSSPTNLSNSTSSTKRVKNFPLPLKLVDKRRSMSGLASPAWSISSFFTTSNPVKPIPIEAITADVIIDYVPNSLNANKRASQDLRLSQDFDEDFATNNRGTSWAGDLTRNTLDLLSLSRRTRPGTPHNRRIEDTPSDDDSPMFGGSTPSDFAMTPDEMIRTPKDTSLYIYNDLEEDYDYRYSNQPVEIDLGRPRNQLRKDALAGLGLDFSGSESGQQGLEDSGRRRSFQPRPVIPSLSLSPPPLSDVEDENDEEQEDEEEINSSSSSQSDFDSAILIQSHNNINNGRTPRILSSPDSFSINSSINSRRSSLINSPSPDLNVERARPHFGTGLRGLYPTPTTILPIIDSPSSFLTKSLPPSPSTSNPLNRFNFVPVSLNLANSSTTSPLPLSIPPSTYLLPPRLKPTRRSSYISSIYEQASAVTKSNLDEIIPSKLFFFAGFFLGPWCWLLGAYYLRSDGEFFKFRGKRCSSFKCNCGSILSPTTFSNKNHGILLVNQNESGIKWGGMEKFIFLNRVAAVVSIVGVIGIVTVAIFIAVSGA